MNAIDHDMAYGLADGVVITLITIACRVVGLIPALGKYMCEPTIVAA